MFGEGLTTALRRLSPSPNEPQHLQSGREVTSAFASFVACRFAFPSRNKPLMRLSNVPRNRQEWNAHCKRRWHRQMVLVGGGLLLLGGLLLAAYLVRFIGPVR